MRIQIFEMTFTIAIFDACVWYATNAIWFLVAAAFMVTSLVARKFERPRKPKPLVIDGHTVRLWDATTGEEITL